MKENPSLTTPCENAAVRIQYWFGNFRSGSQSATPRELSKTHKCNLLKTPHIPSQVKHLPVHGYSLSKPKKGHKRLMITKSAAPKTLKVTIEQATCSVNQKYHPHINAKRVFSFQLKEHFLVCKRLKIIAKQGPVGPKQRQVTSIPSVLNINESPKNTLLDDWAKANEDRPFQDDRVIKRLTP